MVGIVEPCYKQYNNGDMTQKQHNLTNKMSPDMAGHFVCGVHTHTHTHSDFTVVKLYPR